jgi:hypothetical protein
VQRRLQSFPRIGAFFNAPVRVAINPLSPDFTGSVGGNYPSFNHN